jgi:hypothetical protein
MDQRRFEQLLPDYIENNLAGADLAAFNRWLETHPEARAEVRTLRGLVLEISDIEDEDPGSAFWNNFLPELRTRMDEQAERLSLGERLRRVVLRPAILGSMGLAALIIILFTVYTDMGPRGATTIEARHLNTRLESALRGAEDDTLAGLEEYLGTQQPVDEPDAPLLAGMLTPAASTTGEGESWLEPWLEREEQGDRTIGLLEDLDDEDLTRLTEMLRAEMTTG